jgi:hypothetical protein
MMQQPKPPPFANRTLFERLRQRPADRSEKLPKAKPSWWRRLFRR